MQESKSQGSKAAEIRNRIKAITFDFWGTLAIETSVPQNTPSFRQRKIEHFQKCIEAHGHHFDPEKIEAAFRHVYSHFEKLWKRAVGFTAEDGINEALRFLKVDLPESTKTQVIIFFEEIVNEKKLELFPGAKHVLSAFSKRYKIGLISDTAWTPGRVLREQLHRNGVAHFFDTFVFSGEVGYCKPHPVMFQKATEALAVSASECLHVGDLQFTDIKGAKNFGCYAAWIYSPDYLDNSRFDYKPDLVIQSVADLGELLF